MALSAGIKKVVFPVAFVAFAAAMWFGLYRPEFAKIARYRSEPLAQRQQIEDMIQQLSRFDPPTPEERSGWAALRVEMERRIPAGQQISDIYSGLSSLADLNGLNNFTRQTVPNSEKTLEDGGIKRNSFDLTISFECDYGSLVEFLKGLRSLNRLVEVTAMEVNRKVPEVEVKLTLRSYYTPGS
jgi:hypothetical protein